MNRAVPLWTLLFCLALFAAVETRHRRVAAADASYREALALQEQGGLEPADAAMGEALRLAPDNACYLAYRGLLRHRMAGAPDMAALEGMAAQVPPRPAAPLEAAARQQLEAAAGFYEAALRLSPEDGLFRHNLGWLYFFLGKKERALECLEKASESRLRDHACHVSLGLARELSGDPESAVRDYAEAAVLSPRLLESEFFRRLRQRRPQMAEAVVAGAAAALEAKLEEAPDPVAQARLGGVRLESDPERAFALLQEAVAALPNLPRAWFNLGRLHGRKGNLTAMKACFRRASFLDGGDPLALLGMAGVYESEGEALLAEAARARALSPGSGARSAHAGRLSVLYRGIRRMEPDDMVPQGLAARCAPTPP